MTASDPPAHGLLPSARRPQLPVGAQSVPEALASTVARGPDREALVGRFSRSTYRALDDQVRRAAAALAAAGVQPGDRVAGSLGNHPELVVAFLATQRLGAVWVGINGQLTAPEQQYLLDDAGVSVFVGDRKTIARVTSVRGALPELRTVVDAEPGDAVVRVGGAPGRRRTRRGTRRRGRPVRARGDRLHQRHHWPAQGSRAQPAQPAPRGRGSDDRPHRGGSHSASCCHSPSSTS